MTDNAPVEVLPTDQLVVAWMLAENGASDGDAALFLRVLSEGVRRGEEDSVRALLDLKAAARMRDPTLAALLDLGEQMETSKKVADLFGRRAEFMQKATTLEPTGDGVADRLALRSLVAGIAEHATKD